MLWTHVAEMKKHRETEREDNNPELKQIPALCTDSAMC